VNHFAKLPAVIETLIITLDGPAGSGKSTVSRQLAQRLVSSSFDSIKVWDVRRGQEVISLDGVSSDVYCVKFSPDGTKIAAGMLDGNIAIWDSRPLRSILNDDHAVVH